MAKSPEIKPGFAPYPVKSGTKDIRFQAIGPDDVKAPPLTRREGFPQTGVVCRFPAAKISRR